MRIGALLKLLLFFLLSTVAVLFLAVLLGAFSFPFPSSDQGDVNASAGVEGYKTVILDAGHGGEDGGASGANGLVEKDVNLEIAQTLCEMLRANGIDVVMTREDDRLLYDRNADFKGRKKKLDLAARVAIADNTPDAILVSIHMNSFPDPKYAGLQVWYSPNHADSERLAEGIRVTNREMLQPENKRACKEATSAINLLHNAKCPAVLVECGFLTNREEEARFATSEYRQRVAFMLFCSLVEFLDTDGSQDHR